MAFFKSFQQNLPSVNISSLLDTVSSRVDDLANAVSDVTYAVSDQLTEGVTTIIHKVQEEEDGENASGQESGQTATAQEGKASNKSMWQMTRDSETGNTGSKNNQTSDTTEAEYSQSQLEWEWRDGCWRVKKTEAEIAEEEKRKKEEKEMQEKRELRRKEKREKQLEKEAKKNKEEHQEGKEETKEEEADILEKTDDTSSKDRKVNDSGDPSTGQQKSNECDESPQSPGTETELLSKQKKQKDEEGEEEERKNSLERDGDDEEEIELSRSTSKRKKKKSDKKKEKGAKEGSKKSEKASDGEKKKDKGKKSKKKKKGNQEGVLSDSEEDRGPEAAAQQNTTSAWSSKRKQSTEQGGYSSEASSERAANSIQRIKKESSLNELQPPPYQDEGSAACASSRSRSERGVRRGSSPQRCDSPHCSSEPSVDQDTESYLNKGCEEDIPSDSTAVLGPEDGSGPHLPTAYEPEPLAKYGTLDVAFEYDSGEQWLAVTVTAATDIPALKQTGNISWQVHLVLLPTKKQRAKTGVQRGPCPVFTETFKFSRVEQDALGDYAVRFRLYSIRRMKKEKVLGEKVFYLTKLNLQGKIALPVTLEPGSELTGCGSLVSVSRSAGAVSYRSTEDSSTPEILLGLIYNSATGRLSAEVIQGSHFKTTASDKPVNTYVKLTMLDSKGKEMSKCKTAVCRGQPNPTYKETFVFQVALFQLSEVSLVVSVFCRRSSMRPREKLGWVSLGLNSTSEEQQAHWTEMKEAEGQQVWVHCHRLHEYPLLGGGAKAPSLTEKKATAG
ncbi:synaptotagmin-14b isoform X4 [Thunnus maccoyii]|uniref:synaptotagmin-14b isoform X4 n=1 Tax=Thunnus maccoyii TaxID=8240 RepID=UPI001C4C2876|nr:synaptotagmin-14b isoform X4 [Thunnus maccoyii]